MADISRALHIAVMTQMAQEIREIPEIAARQIAEGLPVYQAIGRDLKRRDPAVLVTSARGSSDHAAIYLKYLVESRFGIPVASMGPSVASIYNARLKLANAAMITISQSGASPDLLALIEAACAGGALTVALVNAEGAPAAEAADLAAPLLAGLERAVAASKSYVASLVAIAAIVAEWAGDRELSKAMLRLPKALSTALDCDWSAAEETFASTRSAYCVSRGPGLCIAYEAALKLKETCGLHAEGFSAAEVLHGPVVLAEAGFGALFFLSADSARESILLTAERMSQAGSKVWLVDHETQAPDLLRSAAPPHPALTPICHAVSFYVFVEKLSRALGRDPDHPAHLRKVTRTL